MARHCGPEPRCIGARFDAYLSPSNPSTMSIVENILCRSDRRARLAGVRRVETRVLQGSFVDAIVEFSQDFDYLVLGTHGRAGLERMVAGSVAQKVFERARCAIALVRPSTIREASAERRIGA
jgi:hypothetical protein